MLILNKTEVQSSKASQFLDQYPLITYTRVLIALHKKKETVRVTRSLTASREGSSGYTTGSTVKGKHGGNCIATARGTIEAHIDGLICTNNTVIRGIGHRYLIYLLLNYTIPILCDLLISREGKLQRPTIDSCRTGISNNQIDGKTGGPLIILVLHFTRATTWC